MDVLDANDVIDGYMHRSMYSFSEVCKYDLIGSFNDENREITVDIEERDLDEVVDIISEGMVVQWLKPYVYRQENLEMVLNTRDYTTYSPAEMVMRIGGAYSKAQKDYGNMIKQYSYSHGDLSDLHI